ncbi:MAG: sugar ABC transporter ATP-binding protein [Bauldia litoralis]
MQALDTEPVASAEEGAPADSPILLQIKKLTKYYGSFRALHDMSLELRAGEVHVLFGENGAGKSTMINIVSGATDATSGTITLDGEPLNLGSVRDARNRGIAAVFQEFSLAPELTVEENLFLGVELTSGGHLRKAEMRKKATQVLKDLGFALRPTETVNGLSRAECQMVEIAKAVMTEPRILIFDEPTASLTEGETEILFALIARLKAQGVGIVYITHRIDEIRKIGSRVTVMRDGEYVETLDAGTATKTQLVEAMTGRRFGDFYPTVSFEPGKVVLSIDGLATRDRRVSDVSLKVRAGEIVGLAGLVGCGKSEIGRACFGLEPLARGRIDFLDKTLTRPRPKDLIRAGMGYVPSDRIREGLMLGRSTRENISLSALGTSAFSTRGFLKRRFEREHARRIGERVGIRPLRVEGQVADYSGGNKQKVLLSRAITSPLRLLILDEPTVGIDVSAKAEIYDLFTELIRDGMAILLVSSDLLEVLSLSNRVYVVRQGHIAAELAGDQKTEDTALKNFFGG